MTQSRFSHRFVRIVGLAGASVLALGVGVAVAQESVAGKWAIDVDSPQGATKAILTFTVDGESLKGTIGSEMGETPISGTAKDGTVKFSFDFAGPQGAVSITTTGTITGDEIKGEMDYGMGVAPFVGKRAQ